MWLDPKVWLAASPDNCCLPVLFLKGTLCAGSPDFLSLSLALVKVSSLLQTFQWSRCRIFRRKKIARSSLSSREAKVVQRYGDFLTWQNFCQTFNKVLHSERLPPCGGRAVSRLRVQRYNHFSEHTKFFCHFFQEQTTFSGSWTVHLFIYNGELFSLIENGELKIENWAVVRACCG